MKRKHLTETPVCPRKRLVIISYTTGLSFSLERIGPLASISIIDFYLFALYLFALPNTTENPFASIYSEFLINTTCQHLLLLVGFDTLIYRKYYDTPPILVDHHNPREPGPQTRPLEGAKGQGPPKAAGPSNGTRQRARLEDHVKMQNHRHVAHLQLAR
jgi:hypothetical protein